MKENTDFKERRQHTRTSVKDIIVGVLNSDKSEIIGLITDISPGGIKFTYHELRNESPEQSIYSIDLITYNDYFFNIPCDYAWNKGVGTGADSELNDVRQYGIQFGKLTPSQSFSLKSIITDWISKGSKSINFNTRES